MTWKVNIDTRERFMQDELAVHIGRPTSTGLEVVVPTELIVESAPEAIVTPPALHIDRDLGRALYDALGRALGIYTPDARMAAEVLTREQKRVDKMLDHLIRP